MPASAAEFGRRQGAAGKQPHRLAHLRRNSAGRPGTGAGASARPAGPAAAARVPGSRSPVRSSSRQVGMPSPFESSGPLASSRRCRENSAPRLALRRICQARQERPASVMRVGGKDRSEFDDPAFLARLRQGDQRAYQRLIRRFHGSLVGVAAGDHRQPCAGRGSGAGRLARGACRDRPVRGPLQPDHLGVQHRAEPRPDARQPRGADRRAAGHGGWRRAGGARGAAVGLPAGRALGGGAAAVGRGQPGAHRRRAPALGPRAGRRSSACRRPSAPC